MMRTLCARLFPFPVCRNFRTVTLSYIILIIGALYIMEFSISITKRIYLLRDMSEMQSGRTMDIENQVESLSDSAAESFHEPDSVDFHEPSSVPVDLNNWRGWSKEQLDSLSVMGRRLFLRENVGKVQNRTFTIHIWKSWKQGYRRFMKQYGDTELDPFRLCSVNNCKLTYNDSDVYKADLVFIHLWFTKGPHTFPNRSINLDQKWVWLSDESPLHTFSGTSNRDMTNYNGFFNWSMSYRWDSDIPVPYGRTVMMTDAERNLYQNVDIFNRKPKLVSALISHCYGPNGRMEYVGHLRKYLPLDWYGNCGNLTCPGRMVKDCKALTAYKFYLAFENSDCMQYFTEKPFWNAIAHAAVPVIMGGTLKEAQEIFPPGSFLHVSQFESPKHLADHILAVGQDREKYMKYHAWRSNFLVMNEHGYTESNVFHYCRLCEAMNYNDPGPKEYNHMETYWDKKTQCYPNTWKDRMKAAEAH